MSKYKYFPDSAEEMTGFQLQFAFSEIVAEKTKGYPKESEVFQRVFKEALEEMSEISKKYVRKREREYFRRGMLVN